jgi:streptogramin lyase
MGLITLTCISSVTHLIPSLRATAQGHLKGPEDIAFLPNGDFVVTSHYGDEVVRFSGVDGSYLGVFAKVQSPVGLTKGFDGHVYVTSYVTHTVARHDWTTGERLGIFASGGFLAGPSALAFASPRVLYICSYENDQVVLYNATDQVHYSLTRRIMQQ